MTRNELARRQVLCRWHESGAYVNATVLTAGTNDFSGMCRLQGFRRACTHLAGCLVPVLAVVFFVRGSRVTALLFERAVL
jgi:hypothetical protein